MGYSPWTQWPPRMVRSRVSEPPESVSDESYEDSDVEEVARMSPMMNQFQIPSSPNVDLSSHHMYRTQALQPSVMTFQLSESMLQPVDDREDRHTLKSLLDMNIIADDESEATPPSPSTTCPTLSSIPFGGATFQAPDMMLQHDSAKVTRTSQSRVPFPSPSNVLFPSPQSPANSRVGGQRPSNSKHQKTYQCEQCKKIFSRPRGLAIHMNSHSGAKRTSFVCRRRVTC